ncbi:hydrogenase formation protein HypD, partial [Patescibacteria group bacterium]|nr:hydrogenase formation protein HypD [Patescibacteria group bacterium]
MKNIISKINKLSTKIDRQVILMELCGTHTEAVARHGIKKLLPKNIKLLSGPGCPVCVTDQRDIDAVITLALEGIPIACYGDVLRVPGAMKISNIQYPISNISLDKARELGADVTEVYSVEDALELQKKKPNLVFFGLGFETTAPMTASAIKRGLTVYSSHKAFAPAMAALLDTPQLKVDGFINPGHVSAIIGVEPYKKLLQPTTYNL